jgi:hypothetical protein
MVIILIAAVILLYFIISNFGSSTADPQPMDAATRSAGATEETAKPLGEILPLICPYERLDEDNKSLISKTRPDIKIGLELAGSGFHRLSRLVPLMVASKKLGLMLVSSSPLDYCLHPILGKALMEWYLKDNPNPPIAKLSNIVL